MTELLIIKTGALGDVLRTTSVLPGLAARFADLRTTWVTAPAAADLVRGHRLVAEVLTVDPSNAAAVGVLGGELGARPWDWLISLDDEESLCALARDVARAQRGARLSGATLDPAGKRVYTPDVAPWFDMGLLSVHGKQRADELKVANTRSHAAIYADMLGVELGRPELALPAQAREFAAAFARRERLREREGAVIGLNTGAGGRWRSKALTVERTVRLAEALCRAQGGRATFLVLGGRDERERNDAILEGLRALQPVDAGTENALLEFAGLVGLCDLLIASDSLALHVGVALEVPVVAFFAPTSAAEIELYGCGEKVQSTASDYCSYRPDADTSTLTTERLVAAALRQLAARPARTRALQ